jgi:AcrR family transcriptional regulator
LLVISTPEMARRQPEIRREQILAAATRLFALHGYQATNIADIAADLKLGHGTFYRYFRNKRDIFEQALHDVTVRIGTLAMGETPASTLEEYEAKVRRVSMRVFRYFQQDEAAARILFYESLGVDRDMTQKIERTVDFLAQFTQADLKHGKDMGYLPQELDEARTGHLLNALTFEGIRRCLGKGEDEAERWLDAAVRLVFRGIVGEP